MRHLHVGPPPPRDAELPGGERLGLRDGREYLLAGRAVPVPRPTEREAAPVAVSSPPMRRLARRRLFACSVLGLLIASASAACGLFQECVLARGEGIRIYNEAGAKLLHISFWLPGLLGGTVGAIAGCLLIRQWMMGPEKGLCPSCGYDLRASPGRCPECGVAATRGGA